MMEIQDLKNGMVFHRGKATLTIKANLNGHTFFWIDYSAEGGSSHGNNLPTNYFYECIKSEGWQYYVKPSANQINPHMPKVCRHTNIVSDTWFNRKVYKHCKDCGAAIN